MLTTERDLFDKVEELGKSNSIFDSDFRVEVPENIRELRSIFIDLAVEKFRKSLPDDEKEEVLGAVQFKVRLNKRVFACLEEKKGVQFWCLVVKIERATGKNEREALRYVAENRFNTIPIAFVREQSASQVQIRYFV